MKEGRKLKEGRKDGRNVPRAGRRGHRAEGRAEGPRGTKDLSGRGAKRTGFAGIPQKVPRAVVPALAVFEPARHTSRGVAVDAERWHHLASQAREPARAGARYLQ
jgi:hypothetical protein